MGRPGMEKRIEIPRNTKLFWQGCVLAALGILGPALLKEQTLGIYKDLTEAMMTEQSGALIYATLKLVLMNVIRMIPHYTGAFLINESVRIYLLGKKIHDQCHLRLSYMNLFCCRPALGSVKRR